MQLFHRKKTAHITKYRRFNPHRYWEWLVCVAILAIAIELSYFSWFYLHTTKVLDAPVYPTLETNGGKIKNMEHKLDMVEKAIQDRTGTTQVSPGIQ